MKNLLMIFVALWLPLTAATAQQKGASAQRHKVEIPVRKSSASRSKVLSTMRTATAYMMDTVSYQGGFVWNYLPDRSRQWGELEAYRTMVWVQAPSTPMMGQLLLDAYHATGDEYYYNQAERVARVLMRGQEQCGGWNYMFDLAGENSLRNWYATIGRQAWRLEEFQHYYGNATFDDSATSSVAEFLLRIYVEKGDPAYRPALDKVIDFILQSQYPIGGWPQRYPLMYDHPFQGRADYSSFITLNDDVITDNIEFLIHCYQTLGRKDLKEPIYRAMNLIITLQQGEPYAGWGDQYTVADLQPAHARSYEPRSVNTGTTQGMIRQLISYYRLTGETKFLAGIPAAIDFLESQKLPQSEVERYAKRPLRDGEILVPRFIDPDSGKPLYVHRKGSNVANGTYYIDQDITNTIAHYGSCATCMPDTLRSMYKQIKAMTREEATEGSPLLSTQMVELPRYYVMPRPRRGQQPVSVDEIIASLDKEGRWLTPLTSFSNPYKPLPEGAQAPSDEKAYGQTMVADEYDTSCFYPPVDVAGAADHKELLGISTQTFVYYMASLIQSLEDNE